jgi:hypothetical protein
MTPSNPTRWLDALLVESNVEAVVAFGHLGRAAVEQWRNKPKGKQGHLHFEHLTHPTMPEATSKRDPAQKAAAMKQMLVEWNAALERLKANLKLEPRRRSRPQDRESIPAFDLPIGAPRGGRPCGSGPSARRSATSRLMRSEPRLSGRPRGDRAHRRAPLALRVGQLAPARPSRGQRPFLQPMRAAIGVWFRDR